MKNQEKLVDFLLKNRITILITTLVLTLFWGYMATKLVVDNDPAHTLPDNLKEKIDYAKVKEKFDSPYAMLFLAELDSGTLKEKVQQIKKWEKEFSEITVKDSLGNDEVGFSKVLSISNIKVPVKGGMFGLKSIDLGDSTISNEKLTNAINQNRALTKRLISEDKTTFITILYANSKIDRQKAITKSEDIVNKLHEQGFSKTYITGSTATTWYVNQGMHKDFRKLLPIAIILSMIILYLIFGRLNFVLAPLFIISIALVWAFGIMSLTGFTFSVLTAVIPLILFPVGLADSIHVLKSYDLYRKKGFNYRDSFVRAFNELLSPIILTSITTFFGFASFAFSPLKWTQTFGIFTGLAVMLALIFTVILLPLLVIKDAKSTIEEQEVKSIMPIKFMDWFIFKTPGAILLLVAILGFIAYFLPKLTFENNPITFFNKTHPIVVSDSIVEDKFGGSRFFDVVIESKNDTILFNDSLRWAEVTQIIHNIEKDSKVGGVTSLLPVINRVCELTKKEELNNKVIEMMMSGKGFIGKSFANVVKIGVTKDRKAIKLTVACKNIPHYSYTHLAKEIENTIENNYPYYKVIVGGQALMIDSGVKLVIKTQVESLTLTFVMVALVLMILYRSFSLGLYTTIPIIISTLFIAALMAAMGRSINSITVVIMNSSVGIGIDYAIHFTAGFLRERTNYKDNITAILETIHHKGTVIIYNTIAVGAGFLILTFSHFPPVKDLGLFIFLSMAVSSLFTLIFLPLLLRIKKFKAK